MNTNNLKGLRKIRNKFAHSFENINFNTQQIKDLIHGNLTEITHPSTNMRELFYNWFITLNGDLFYRAKEILTEKRKSKIYKFKPVRNITFVEVDSF